MKPELNSDTNNDSNLSEKDNLQIPTDIEEFDLDDIEVVESKVFA